MKVFRNVSIVSVVASCMLICTRCGDECKVTNTYVYFEPVYSTSAEVKAAVRYMEPQPIKNLGRIYFKDGFLFLNETARGIHVIDNRNPSSPQPVGFINIPGNFDLSVVDQVLYADSYVDLVAFDISDIDHVKEIARVERLFNHYQSMGFQVASEKGIITDWKQVENVTVNVTECDARSQFWGGMLYAEGVALDRATASAFNASTALAPVSTPGIAGSLSRFAVNGKHLYAMDGANLDIVDLATPSVPIAKKEMAISWDVETLFPYKNKLFFGTQSGMLIYDLANAETPEMLSRYAHVRSCDPVVVAGDHAYVTLHDGTACGGFSNQLEVINISDVNNPVVEKICQMSHPRGLGIDGDVLFVCDDKGGLAVYDASDIMRICDNKLIQYPSILTLDVIPDHHIAMAISADALYQYDYSDVRNIKLLSTLSFQHQ